jgi:predicted PurR-regulated permease PerM
LAEIFRIATQISTPLALAGFLAAAFFLIVRLILKAQKRPAESIVRQIIDRLFVLSLVAMVLGFAGWVLTAVQKAHATTGPNSTPVLNGAPVPDHVEVKKPEPTLHDGDESGIRYKVMWSVDANCTG